MADLISKICIVIQKENFEEIGILLSKLKESQIDLRNHNDIVVFSVNMFTPDDTGITPLHILLRLITPIYTYLISKIKPSLKQNFRETYDQIINMILQTNEQGLNNVENNGVTYLHIACTKDEPETVEKFLQNGACVNQTVGTFIQHEGFSPLLFAVKYNCVKVAKFLLEHGANVNQVSGSNDSALHLTDSPELVQLLVQHGADVTLKDADGNTPLHKAFEERYFKIMDILLSAHLKIDANPSNAIGMSHFHIACTRNNEDVVKHFLKNGASINICVSIDPNIDYTAYSYSEDIDWRGCSPLHFAAAFNVSKIVEILLSHKADIKIQDARGFTALHMACRSLQERYEELVTNSLQSLKDANAVDPKCNTKADKHFDIQNATGEGRICDMFRPKSKAKPKVIDWKSNREEHINMIKLLLKFKSDVNCHDKFGNTPIFYTYVWYAFNDSMLHEVKDDFLWEMLARRKLITTMLLRHKVDLDTCHKNGSILHFMVEESLGPNSISGYDELGLLEKFLKKGLTIDALNKKMLTPLFILVQKTARTDFISLLIRHGANVNFQEPEEHATPLHVALENNFDKEQLIFDEVLCGGANPNLKKSDGTTVLHYLAGEFYYYPRIFEKLVGAGADIDARDAKGQTPLFRACHFWNDGLAKLLLRNGADINIEDNEGKTVLCVMYEEKLLSEKISGPRYAEMTCSLFDVLLNHVAKKRASVSDKVLSSRGKVIDYLNTHVDKSYKNKHK